MTSWSKKFRPTASSFILKSDKKVSEKLGTQESTVITAIIVGAGHRALAYARLAELQPERFKIVGVADPNPLRRKMTAERFGFGSSMCFENAAELAQKGKLADAVINGTMDEDHVPTALPLLEAGYHILLEKPFAVSEEEVWQLRDAVKRTKRRVMICHVLRYAPFYTEIKKRVLNGEIGEIIHIHTSEHVSYHHMVNSFVRGKWRRQDVCKSSMLMAKCCHDLDLISWFLSGVQPIRLSSLGGRKLFCAEKAPPDSGSCCLVDCPLVDKCTYSTRQINLNHPKRWAMYVWAGIEHIKNPTMADYTAYLSCRDNPFARCAWKMDNNVVDRQSVIIEFANGALATHDLVAGSSRGCRKIHIIGTLGEIEGSMEDSMFTVRRINTAPGHEFDSEKISLKDEGDTTGAFGGHGGGDIRLIDDFVASLEGHAPSISCTTLEDSINGHLIGFLADKAMNEHRIVDFLNDPR